MAKFRGLTDIVITTIEERVKPVEFPAFSHSAIQTGQYVPPQGKVIEADHYFRWGVSGWGLSPITPTYKPEQPEK